MIKVQLNRNAFCNTKEMLARNRLAVGKSEENTIQYMYIRNKHKEKKHKSRSVVLARDCHAGKAHENRLSGKKPSKNNSKYAFY